MLCGVKGQRFFTTGLIVTYTNILQFKKGLKGHFTYSGSECWLAAGFNVNTFVRFISGLTFSLIKNSMKIAIVSDVISKAVANGHG